MTLPSSRNVTAAPGAQVQSALLNALQDQIIGAKHPTLTITLPIVAPFVSAGGSPGSESQNISGSTTSFQCGIQLPVGTRITACRADIRDNATGPTKLQLQVVKAQHGSTTSLGTSAPSAGNGTQQTISLTGLTEVIASGWSYHVFINFQTGSASSFINAVEIDIDRL